LTGRFRPRPGDLFRNAGRLFLAAGLAWACLWPAPAARAAGGYLAVACLRRNAGQCGVINDKGDWVVLPAFDQIGDFAPNGLAVAVKRRRPGVINTRGEWVIEPVFDKVDEEWSAGLIKVGLSEQRGDWLYGLADESGRLVVEPSFREIQNFGPNLLAGARDQKDRYGFINREGVWAVPPVFTRVEPFAANGLAPAIRAGEDLWGYIDASGEFAIPPAYEQAFPFDGDRAKVRSDDGLYGLINSKGQAVGKQKFAHLGDFDSGGLAPAQKELDGLYGLVNRNGAWVAQPSFELVYSFNGGNLAPARQDGLFGFINRSGQWVIKPAFGNVDDFEIRLGRAPAEQSGAWGLIDSGGNWVVSPDHLLLLNAGSGANGPLQVFAENGRWGLMDENGRWLLEPILTASPYFAANGLSEARIGALYGFIDRFGHWVLEPAFQQVGPFKPVPSVPPALSSSAARPEPAPPAEEKAAPPEVKAAKPDGARTDQTPGQAPTASARRSRAHTEPAPTRLVVPDKPAAQSPAPTAETVRPARPARLTPVSGAAPSPPTGYIPPAEPASAGRRPAGPPKAKPAKTAPEPAETSQSAPSQVEPGPDAGSAAENKAASSPDVAVTGPPPPAAAPAQTAPLP
jgi:hypothetical protein